MQNDIFFNIIVAATLMFPPGGNTIPDGKLKSVAIVRYVTWNKYKKLKVVKLYTFILMALKQNEIHNNCKTYYRRNVELCVILILQLSMKDSNILDTVLNRPFANTFY